MPLRRSTPPDDAASPGPPGPDGRLDEFRERLRRVIDTGGRLVARPPGQLAGLPPRYRWEVTRRHPYYLVAWDEVRAARRGEPPVRPLGRLVAFTGEAALAAIGVSGEPVDPALEFEDPAFGGGDPFVISGACQPLVLRDLALLLMNALPPADRAAVGAILSASGVRETESPPADPTAAVALTERLKRLPSAALNSYPLAPFFYLHLGSSQRTVIDDVTAQVRLRQRSRALARATRPETLDDYLKVWDEREGWTGRGYGLRGIRTLAEIAGARAGRRRTSTAFDRYRRAFELIVGRPYSFGLWFGLFGFLKLNRYLGDPADRARPGDDADRQLVASKLRASLRRHARPKRGAEAPDPPPATPRPTAGEAVQVEVSEPPGEPVAEGYGVADLVLDVAGMFAAGRTDAEVADALGVADAGLVAGVRARYEEERGLGG